MASKARPGRGHGEAMISPGLGKRGLQTGYVITRMRCAMVDPCGGGPLSVGQRTHGTWFGHSAGPGYVGGT